MDCHILAASSLGGVDHVECLLRRPPALPASILPPRRPIPGVRPVRLMAGPLRRPAPFPALGAVDGEGEANVLEVTHLSAPEGERLGRLERWLMALDAPVQLLVESDRLGPAEIHPLGADHPGPLAGDLAQLAMGLAREGVVGRRLLLVTPPTAALSPAALAEAGLETAPVDAPALAACVRRLLGAGRHLDLGRVRAEPRFPSRRERSAAARLARAERTWRDLVVPDHLHVHPAWIEADDAAAVLLYLDGLPREMGDDGLSWALRGARDVDVGLRLWPVPTDAAVRHLTRRLRDLRASQRAGDGADDFRAAAAVDDAERLREALYLGETRLVQVAAVFRCHGRTAAQARQAAQDLRMRLGRAGFLARAAVLRQWPALASMLPGAPDRLGEALNVTAEVAARLLPFALLAPVRTGVLLGRDADDAAPVHLDRTRLSNPAAVYLGSPGSGKSTLAKMEILRRARRAVGDRFVVVDPEGEYGPVVDAVEGGAVVDASAPGGLRLPLLTALGHGARADAAGRRAATLLAPLLDARAGRRAAALERALVEVAASGGELGDLPARLGPLDADLARRAEAAVSGPLAILAAGPGPSEEVRALALDLSGVDSALLPALLPALTEAAVGHLLPAARRSGGWLWLTLDEFHLYLAHEGGARRLVEWVKRARKRGIAITAVSQHVVDLVRHPDGQAILAACEVVALFRPGVDPTPFAAAFGLEPDHAQRLVRLAPGEALIRAADRWRWVRIALTPQEHTLADTRPAATAHGRTRGRARPASRPEEVDADADGQA